MRGGGSGGGEAPWKGQRARLLRRNVGPPGIPGSEGGPGADEDGPLEPAGPPAPDPPELPPRMRRFLRRGLLVYPLAAGGLWAFTSMGVWNALFLATLLELLPVLSVAQVPLAAGRELDRTAAYLGSGGAILFLGWISLFLGQGTLGLEAMGLSSLPWQSLLIWTGVGLGGGLALVGLSLFAEKLLGIAETEFVRQIVPRTAAEKTLFVGVSLAAGLGEELAYRGYAIPVLAGLVGSEWIAAVFTSGIFGFLHAYQGHVGVVRTALMGFVLAAVFLLSGSLWPAMAAHALIDLVGGLVIGPRLLER